MRIVWGRANSSNVMKLVWLLETLAVPYTRTDAGGDFGRTREPGYLAMNPTGAIPTLQEDGFTLWESNVILRYLAAEHAPGTPLWPATPRARANIDRWMDWQQTSLGPPHGIIFQGLIRTPPAQRDHAAIQAATTRTATAYAMLEAQLTQHAHIAGPDFTLADIAIGVHAHRWFCLDVARPDLPHLRAWYDRLLALPVYRQHVALPLT